jgi:hypothetical protein
MSARIAAYLIVGAYNLGLAATFVFLTFFDDVRYTWWNWILILPINVFQSAIWPAYWPVRWLLT